MRNDILCPFCLDKNTIAKRSDNEGREQYYSCSSCLSTVPREYAENTSAKSEVVCTVGFRGHGKTLYFSSLFKCLDQLADIWPGFYSFATDEKSLNTVKENIMLLKQGELPPPTPASFPIPTNIRFSNIPSIGHRFFLFYDTGGEAYAQASKLIKYASFIKRSRTVIFLVSLEEIEYDGEMLHELLSVYVQGLTEMGGNPKDQDLLVVYSKGDLIGSRLKEWQEIRKYLASGGVQNLANFKLVSYVTAMKKVSARIRKFTRKELNALQFLNFANDQFKSVEFSVISSLGAKPEGSRLQVSINPKCIFDPLIWVAYNSLSWFQKSFLSWTGK